MTKAIPEGAPRKRPARACLACRKVKAACVVKEREVGRELEDCLRCQKNSLSCEFVALRKIGRPRRLIQATAEEPSTIQVNPTLLAGIKRESSLPPLSPPLFSPPILYDLSPTGNELVRLRSYAESERIGSIYLAAIHHFLPILPSNYSTLTIYLRSAPNHLLLAISALGQDLEVQLPDLVPCLHDIQTALILVHALYGQGHVSPAKSLMRWAAEAILKLGYQHLDQGNPVEMDEQERDMIRKVWWECWCAEVMIHVVTSSRQFVLQGISFQINLPSEADPSSVSSLGLRVRALSLLVIATEVPTGTAVPVARLEALERIGQNLAFLAGQRSMKLHPHALAEREAAFMAGLISNAAIIYLYSASYAASAFVCGFDSVQQLPTTSLQPIRKAGQHIFNLIRSSPSLGTSHSPFFGCSILVAAQGMMLSLEEAVPSPWNVHAVASDLELGQEILQQHSERWKGSAVLLNEVKRLRLSIDQGDMSHADLILPDSFVI